MSCWRADLSGSKAACLQSAPENLILFSTVNKVGKQDVYKVIEDIIEG